MTTQPRKRPKIAKGNTHKISTGCGNLYVTVNRDEEGLLEVFSHLGKSGQCGAAQIEGICRLLSIALRSGVDPNSLVKQLKGIRCPSPVISDGIEVLSCSDAIASAVKKEIEDEEKRASKVEKGPARK